jgi:hypothetical protein
MLARIIGNATPSYYIDCDDVWPHAIDSLQQQGTSYEAVCSRTGGGGGE